MAITIKKTKNVQFTPQFDLEGLVKSSISSLIVNELNLRNDRLLRYIEYFPVYTICEATKDKSIGSFFLRSRFDPTYRKISIKHIELSGATIVEFVEFLEEKGATLCVKTDKILEVI